MYIRHSRFAGDATEKRIEREYRREINCIVICYTTTKQRYASDGIFGTI